MASTARRSNGQGDTVATVYTDTLATRSGHVLDEWQLVVRLMRPTGTRHTPRLRSVGAMASALPDAPRVPRSPNGRAHGRVLDVPTFSQEKHIGHFPQWDNGGEAWCSPTSTSMVLAYWGAGPRRDETAWVTEALPTETDPQVDFAARNVFDYTYDGCGNWPFNAAYAATAAAHAGVRHPAAVADRGRGVHRRRHPARHVRLLQEGRARRRGLRHERPPHGRRRLHRGRRRRVQRPGLAPARDNAQVRVVYDREQFENVWVPHSGGIVYVIHPERHRLPRAPRHEPNW